MKLYEIELPARVMVACSDGSDWIEVDHLDGIYSFCQTQNGAVVHIGAWTDLTQNKDGTWNITYPAGLVRY